MDNEQAEAVRKFTVGRTVYSIEFDMDGDDIEIHFLDGAYLRLSTLGGIDVEEMAEAEEIDG